MTISRTLVIAVALAASTTSALGQEFPDDDAWVAFECFDEPMSDPYRDRDDAIDELDLVGDEDDPAGLRAADEDFLYLRLRLDASPIDEDGTLRQSGWGVAFNQEGRRDGYHTLIMARGSDQSVTLFENDETTLLDDPADPPTEPPVSSAPFADHGRSVEAGSSFGGTADQFLDLAISWDDLAYVGIVEYSSVHAWLGTSISQTALDGDLACHDGVTGEGALSGAAADATPADPRSGRLEGGGGCSTGGGPPLPSSFAALLVALGLLARRRSRNTPAP